jgi:hypothetical protein
MNITGSTSSSSSTTYLDRYISSSQTQTQSERPREHSTNLAHIARSDSELASASTPAAHFSSFSSEFLYRPLIEAPLCLVRRSRRVFASRCLPSLAVACRHFPPLILVPSIPSHPVIAYEPILLAPLYLLDLILLLVFASNAPFSSQYHQQIKLSTILDSSP